jgi:uncharacterized protein YecE (DUF72 family)
MLPYYAERFSTVEINYTFYRMPTAKLVTGWAAQLRRLSLTLAPRRIRTIRREVADSLVRSGRRGELGPRLGALLFSCRPPSKDLAALDDFLATLPPRCAAPSVPPTRGWTRCTRVCAIATSRWHC